MSGKPSQCWDKHNVDWAPSLNLGKKREKSSKAATKRAERAKARRKSALEQQQLEAAKKMTLLNESGPQVVDINFSSDSASTSGDVEAMELGHEDAPVVCPNEAEQEEESMATGVETQTEAFDYLYRKTVRCETPDKDAETQTEAFNYLYRKTVGCEVPDKDAETQTEEFDYLVPKSSGYQAPDREFFKGDEKVRFYTGLPSYEVLLVTFEHAAPYVARRAQEILPLLPCIHK